MRIRVYSLLLCFVFCTVSLSAQQTDEHGRNLDKLTLKKRGLNKERYSHFFIGYGFLLGKAESDSAQTIIPKSSSFQLGYLHKRKVNNWYELGFDLMYHYRSFHIQQDSMKKVPNNQLVKKEKLVFNSIQLMPFQRIKFKNKYHSAGIFLDMGAFAGWNYRIKHQTQEINNTPHTGKTKTVNLRLNYTEDFTYGVMARLGINRFVFYGRYYFSDLFKDQSNLPELTRYEVGLRIGVHQ